MGLKKKSTGEYARVAELRIHKDRLDRSIAIVYQYPDKETRNALREQTEGEYARAQSYPYELGEAFADAMLKAAGESLDAVAGAFGAAYSALKELGEFKGADTWEDVLDDSVPAAAAETVKW